VTTDDSWPRRRSDRPSASGDSPGVSLRGLAPEQALRRLELIITRRLDGLLHGDYLGLVPGSGSELAETREYHPGEDDVRRMDWNVTARTTVPHVRDLIADRELETWALVDATPSMDFGTALVEKRDLAVAAVAAVGFLTARAGNRIGAHIIAGSGRTATSRRRPGSWSSAARPEEEHSERIIRIPARAGRAHLLSLLRLLLDGERQVRRMTARGGSALGPGGRSAPVSSGGSASGPVESRLAEAADGLHRSAHRRGLIVVVSDFLDGLDSAVDTGLGTDGEGPAWERSIRRLAHRHHVLAVEVLDPRELELPDVGLLTLIDPETGQRREVSTASKRLRERYAAAAAEQRELVGAALRRSGADHLVLRTDRDWVRDIVWHVVAQRRRARAHAVQPGPPLAALGGQA
jgi:uncharacterized protein (DUF58 family)